MYVCPLLNKLDKYEETIFGGSRLVAIRLQLCSRRCCLDALQRHFTRWFYHRLLL